MIDPIVLLAFVPAALALNLTPGADMMFCLGVGMRSGPPAAVAASAGITLGGLIHATVAGLGLGTIVATQPWVFDAIRWVGVCYLLWLALGAIRGVRVAPDAPAKPVSRAFASGLLVNLTNPKVILFVLAFVPQFVDPQAGSILTQFMIFGLIQGIGGFVINGLVGVFASGAGRRLTASSTTTRVLGYVSGGIFAVLAVRLAILERA